MEALIAEKRARQSLPLAVIAGALAALVGAAIWAAITLVTKYQIGWTAVGVGFLVGFAVRFGGKGIDPIFGYLGAILSLLGCLLGNLFSAMGFFAEVQSVSFFDVLGGLNVSLAVELLKVTFPPMDILFYGIAVYEKLPVLACSPVAGRPALGTGMTLEWRRPISGNVRRQRSLTMRCRLPFPA